MCVWGGGGGERGHERMDTCIHAHVGNTKSQLLNTTDLFINAGQSREH